MRFRKKPVEVEAHQWHKNGDHPLDRVGKRELDVMALADLHPELFTRGGEVGPIPEDAPTYERLEGAVVRFFRRPEPEYAGDRTHELCGRTWHDHGWIDTLVGGHTVCPGDWIITGVQGEVHPCKPDIFAATYEPVFPALDEVIACPACEQWEAVPYSDPEDASVSDLWGCRNCTRVFRAKDHEPLP